MSIGFKNSASQLIHIDLLDLSGRVIERIESRNLAAGIQTIDWSCSHIAAGTYLVRVQGEQTNATRPLLISE